jgi:hypothetical protein
MPQRNLVFPEGEPTPLRQQPAAAICRTLESGIWKLPLQAACPHAARRSQLESGNWVLPALLQAGCPHPADTP